jgi:hypothetical protein
MNRTRAPSRDRWTAFLLSLVAPGAGQLYLRHRSCVAWFLVVAALTALTTWLSRFGPMAAILGFVALVMLGIASAEHARRCLESAAGRLRSRLSCGSTGTSSVRLRIEVDVPRDVSPVWAIAADVPRFACVDPFHSRVVMDGAEARAGVSLALEHRAFGFTLWRTGRLLSWREGHGYAFSDLSTRGIHTGFPHVFFVTVLPRGAHTCLRIDIRGKWTAGWVPRWLRHAWLRYVCLEHARLLSVLFSQEETWLTLNDPARAMPTGAR